MYRGALRPRASAERTSCLSDLLHEEQCLWAVEAIAQMRLSMPHLHPDDSFNKSKKKTNSHWLSAATPLCT